MEPDDEEPLEPYRSPDDRERIWLHPSELGSLLPPVPEAGRLRRRRRPPWRRFRALTVPVLSGMIGAALSLGILALAGGLEAVLAACRDKPAIRRRAVLALAAFEGPAVDGALRAALDDKDWQTRQAAEDLLSQ